MTTIKKRTSKDQRKEQILKIAVNIATKATDYTKITRQEIARSGKFSVSLITKYFTIAQLQRAVLTRAIQNESIEILAQGLARRDKQVMKLPGRLKTKVAAYLTR